MHDATDHATIIDPRLAARAGRQVGRNLRELRVRQPEEVPTHWWPPEEVLNHESADRSNPFMGPDPRLARTSLLQDKARLTSRACDCLSSRSREFRAGCTC